MEDLDPLLHPTVSVMGVATAAVEALPLAATERRTTTDRAQFLVVEVNKSHLQVHWLK